LESGEVDVIRFHEFWRSLHLRSARPKLCFISGKFSYFE
jgi:hypothetical protein